MSYIHYKFASKLAYGTVIFNEPLISLSVLKREIMSREKLSAKHCKLQIFNAQTQKEYISEEDLIPKNSSVTVRRVPLLDVKTSNKTSVQYVLPFTG
uniref:DWNN domain-containing protein n=1 Tax=Scleropages formosus TaxID=113540 RepID=A0A8C9RG18_SCLFO